MAQAELRGIEAGAARKLEGTKAKHEAAIAAQEAEMRAAAKEHEEDVGS